MQTIKYKRLKINKLGEIKLLWEDLNDNHLKDSIYFKEHYTTYSFEKRSAGWLKLPKKNFHLLIAETKDLVIIGYCVSTIDENWKGEIDSLYIKPEFRQQGIGKTTLNKSFQWLQIYHCKPIQLSVSYGHESVIGFYQKLGYYPKFTTLEWIVFE